MNTNLSLYRRMRYGKQLVQAFRAPHDHHYAPNEPKPHDYDEPPTADEIIKIHYLKHYSHWEFQNFQDPAKQCFLCLQLDLKVRRGLAVLYYYQVLQTRQRIY